MSLLSFVLTEPTARFFGRPKSRKQFRVRELIILGSLASASPVTDGKHLYAFFGSYGLYCLDFDGEVVWQKEFGQMHTKHGHGEGASPALHGDVLVINWDHEEDSFIMGLDKTSGDEIWRNARGEVTSWSSPVIVEHGDTVQTIVAGTERVRVIRIIDR